jgi:branched-chain amino acid transport system ATP-binding protein
VSAVLTVQGIEKRFGTRRVLNGASFAVHERDRIGMIGANGAGKSTLLKTIAGSLRAAAGSVVLDGVDITRLAAHRRVIDGLALVPEGRRLFPSLTVEENLLVGTYRRRDGAWNLERVYELFPWMPQRRAQSAALLSGGEQQAVAIGRALVSNPRLLMIDELSLGLAPVVVERIYSLLPQVLAAGTSVLLVEQDVSQALRVADRVHCLLEGRTVLEGTPRQFSSDEIQAAYFGLGNNPTGHVEADRR